MRRTILLTFALCALIGMAQSRPSVALYVTGNAPDNEKQYLSHSIVNILTQSNKYAIMNRSDDIYELLQLERDYQMSGEVNNSDMCQIGRELGVDYVIVADLSKVRGGSYFASLRMIDINTGKIKDSTYNQKSLNGLSDLQAMAKSLSNKLMDTASRPSGNVMAAVYVTTERGINPEYQPIIESIVITGLTNDAAKSGVSVVERSDDFLKKMKDENDYQVSGVVDKNEIREIGRVLGVKYLYAVDVSKIWGETVITVSCVDIDSRQEVSSWSKSAVCENVDQIIALTESLMATADTNDNKEPTENREIKVDVKVNHTVVHRRIRCR